MKLLFGFIAGYHFYNAVEPTAVGSLLNDARLPSDLFVSGKEAKDDINL